ncbi:hypothetical protein JCM15519_09690 [Fundidesulfovibrio butyratiphilus]
MVFSTAPARAEGWSTFERGGVRWLSDPSGRPFYSIGADTVNGFKNDAKAKAGKAYYWGRYYPSLEDWGADTQKRLESWGFNTLGGWSEESKVMSLPIIPETDLGRNSRLHWFDAFAPEMDQVAVDTARRILKDLPHGPRLIGVFTDNEVGWWNAPLFSWHLAQNWGIYSKRVLWRLLYDTYQGRWEELTRDFVPGKDVDGFESLKASGASLKLRPGGHGIKVIGRFTYLVARRYYDVAFRAVRKAAPGVLVVGDRLPLYYCQDAVLAQKGLVDVLSTNYNVDCPDGWVAPYYFEGLAKLSPAPVLISEFFFAARENRSGNANNGHLMHVDTQEQRARGAAAAMANFAGFPNVAGTHWFQYTDEPSGGRNDGEDFNMGLVDNDNRPYELLTETLARQNPTLAGRHASSRWESVPPESAQIVLLRAKDKSLGDGSLLDWPRKADTRLLGFHTPSPYVPFGDVHLAWGPEGLYFFNIAGNYVDLSLLDYQGEYPLSETYQIHFYVDAGAGERHFAAHLSPRPHSVWPGRFELVPQLWRYENDKPVERLDTAGRLQALDKPLPHIQVEGLLSSGLLGVDKLEPGQVLTVRVRVTNFYNELTMTWDRRGQPREVVLGRAVDTDGANP